MLVIRGIDFLFDELVFCSRKSMNSQNKKDELFFQEIENSKIRSGKLEMIIIAAKTKVTMVRYFQAQVLKN
jgi:hypothetical protein